MPSVELKKANKTPFYFQSSDVKKPTEEQS